MNITELARILKVNPNFLREKLPEMGFDVGAKAIKVDNQTARKIIKAWPQFKRKLEKEEEEKRREEEAKKTTVPGMKKKIEIPEHITVREFAQKAELPVNKLLGELMKNGIFTSLNEKIDYDTAAVVGEDLGVEVELKAEEESEDQSKRIQEVIDKQEKDTLKERPPVIVVMGHVDHGKTKLLDAIRATNVVDTESGGITQHIGAYQVERKDKTISFIDTPGHEAFTAMRNRGAKVADIAILVVAADDGVKPQTIEAYRIIEAAKLPFVVAINKIDKPDADVNKTLQDLANQLNIVPEDWGGKTICVPVSAKQEEGITDLLDMLLLVSDMEDDRLKANPDAPAVGTVIESRVDKGEGIVATLMVQNGTLHVGDSLVCRGVDFGKARALKNYLGENIDSAGPSTPAKVIGFKIAPEVGDIIEVGQGVKAKGKKRGRGVIGDVIQSADQDNGEDQEQINIIIKSDTLGSGEAIEGSLSKIDTMGVKIKILSKELGNVTEGDVVRAESSNAQIIGFNVQAGTQALELARESDVQIKLYNIIYDLISDIKKDIQEAVKPEIKRVDLGKIKVLAIFHTDKDRQIIGGKVTSGQVEPAVMAEVYRDDEFIDEGKLNQLKVGKQDVDKVEQGGECGMTYEGRPVVKEGDTLNLYKEETIYKKIS